MPRAKILMGLGVGEVPISMSRLRIPRLQTFKLSIYYSPVVPPLERGPDFSFLDGRRPAITSKWEFERRVKQVALAVIF